MTDQLCRHDLAPGTCSSCKPPDPLAGTVDCRSCGAPVLWVKTENGKRMPLDPTPVPDGKFLKARVDADGDKIVHFLRRDEDPPPNRQRFDSHFSTCPDADRHRQR